MSSLNGGSAAKLRSDLKSNSGGDIVGGVNGATFSPIPFTILKRQTRRLHVMDFMDKTQWSLIEAGTTAGQDGALVTAGFMNALRKMKELRTELDIGYGAFLIQEAALSGAYDCKISGRGLLQVDSGFLKVLSITTSSRLIIDGPVFRGRSVEAGSYAAEWLLDINVDSSFVTVERCGFTNFRGYGAVIRQLAGGTYSETCTIKNNEFYDAPAYAATSPQQAGIACGNDGEYCKISENKFFRIPAAARFTDGANCLFADNIAMQCNGGDGTLQTDRAVVYCEGDPVYNAGKITIARNKINHNATGLIPVICKGDPAKPQNAYELLDNDFLVNGNATVGYQVVLYDAPRSKIRGNKFRPATASAHGHANVRLNSCSDAIISDNYFEDGKYSVTLDASTNVQWHSNLCNAPATGKIELVNGATIKNRNARAFAFRVSAAGAAGTPYDDASWTASRPATGQFTVAHNMNTTDYSVEVETDASTTAPERHISINRAANSFDVYVKDSAGAAVNENLLITVTVGNTNSYAL